MSQNTYVHPSWNKDTHPQAVIAWALAKYDSELIMTSGFNLNGVVLIDMAVNAGFRGKVLFVDTGYHFRETLDTRDALTEQFPELEFISLSANQADDAMYLEDTDKCCHLRKVIPLQEKLKELAPKALLSARSQDQSDTRKDLRFIELAEPQSKVNPLVYWNRERLEHYAKEHKLPINPLYWDGFLSIGCGPCTRAVRPGEHSRAGRWAGTGKTECGLWTSKGL